MLDNVLKLGLILLCIGCETGTIKKKTERIPYPRVVPRLALVNASMECTLA